MAIEEEQEVETEEDDNKPNETILEEQKQRDPDEMVFAEQAIHHYADQVLSQFSETVDMAVSSIQGFLSSQIDPEAVNEAAVHEGLATSFLDHLMAMFGGADSPIGTFVFEQMQNHVGSLAIDLAATDLAADLGAYATDATDQIQANLQSVLSNDWDNLRDLAYEGSTDFVPVLHALGLPQAAISPQELSEPLIGDLQAMLDELPKKTEETIDQSQLAVVEEEQQEMGEEEQQLIEEDEKEAQTV